MCDAIALSFDLRPASTTSVKGAEGLVAFAKGTETPIFSFVPPTGGCVAAPRTSCSCRATADHCRHDDSMFLWARFYLTNSPRYASHAGEADPEQAFMDKLWKDLVAASVRYPFSAVRSAVSSLTARLAPRRCSLCPEHTTRLGRARTKSPPPPEEKRPILDTSAWLTA